MRRRTATFIAILAAAFLFAIPLWMLLQPEKTPDGAGSPPPGNGLSGAGRNGRFPAPYALDETNYKLQAVRRDVQMTERLCRLQCERDALRWLKETARMTDKQKTEHLRRTRQHNPKWRLAAWLSADRAHPAGADPAKLAAPARKHWEQTVRSVRQGKAAQSPVFRLNGQPHFVLGVPDPQKRSGGLVVLVAADVLLEVERHQRRNMRLVPYPEEGRYRIESVRPDDLKDTTVRSGEDNGNASHYTVDEVVVRFREPLDARQLLALRRELDLIVVRRLGPVYVFRSRSRTADELTAYFRKQNVVYVEPHYLYLTNGLTSADDSATFRRALPTPAAATGVESGNAIVPNDTYYASYQWNLPAIATEEGWNVTRGNDDIVVAVIDTGVQTDHPDLTGRLVEGFNAINPGSPPKDDVGHGTHVAGIIAATVNNAEGVAGMTWHTKIMPVKVLDSSGVGSAYSVAEGIIWATDHGADVINLSLGNYAQAEFLHDAVRYAYERGVVLVAASGNDNTSQPGYPAAYPEVLAVAATDSFSNRASYSNYGDYIDVAAPGTNIPSTFTGSQYTSLSGTSMASPHVAALAALVRSVNPGLTPAEVMDLLRQTANDKGTPGRDPEYGYGLIHVRRALEQASGTTVASREEPLVLDRLLRAIRSLLAPLR